MALRNLIRVDRVTSARDERDACCTPRVAPGPSRTHKESVDSEPRGQPDGNSTAETIPQLGMGKRYTPIECSGRRCSHSIGHVANSQQRASTPGEPARDVGRCPIGVSGIDVGQAILVTVQNQKFIQGAGA